MNEKDILDGNFFRRKVFLNLSLGGLGLAGLIVTFAFLWGSPGFFLENPDQPPTDASGVGTGLLCILYLIYLVAVTVIVWEEKSRR